MLCTIALRRTRSNDADCFDLRITGKTALGPSGTGGQDIRTSQTADEVRSTLQQLGLTLDALADAEDILNFLPCSDRFTPIADDAQVPFETLERAGYDLFD